jgi:peptidoglycan/xylan/chitin deacetylase (PgdA/CDA1 family)
MAASELVAIPFPTSRWRLAGTPVLMYHELAGSRDLATSWNGQKYRILASQFRGHLDIIRQQGRRVASLRTWWPGRASSDEAEGQPPVVLTFDDGRESDFRIAYPALLDANLRADFFVNTATVGTAGFLSWSQMAEMHRAGLAFQSHSHDHVDLARLPVLLLERQLRESKQKLEDHLGDSVEFLAVPYGLVNKRVVSVAQQEGYRAVCTSRNWPAQPGAPTVNRIAIHRGTTLSQVAELIACSPAPYLARLARSTVLEVPKRLLIQCRPSALGVDVLRDPA